MRSFVLVFSGLRVAIHVTLTHLGLLLRLRLLRQGQPFCRRLSFLRLNLEGKRRGDSVWFQLSTLLTCDSTPPSVSWVEVVLLEMPGAHFRVTVQRKVWSHIPSNSPNPRSTTRGIGGEAVERHIRTLSCLVVGHACSQAHSSGGACPRAQNRRRTTRQNDKKGKKSDVLLCKWLRRTPVRVVSRLFCTSAMMS